ncbi:MAG TPA: RNA polymerase sigma factor [Pirellulaceae bacterium]|jgi:RNA polymerase sigma-70 factor (ECF subfamily)
MDSASPDWLLIAAALEGEEQAFALLVERYQGPLHKAAISRLGRRELAEEAVQETFLCAHRWLATYDSRYSFRTWLWTVMLNQCSRKAKKEGLGVRDSGLGEEEAGDKRRTTENSTPLEVLLAKETSEQVQELLARLPEAQADALRLRFFGGLTFPEIAAAMGISEPGAKHRVKTGLVKLAEWLRGPQQPGPNLVPEKLGGRRVGDSPGAGLLPAIGMEERPEVKS